MSPTRLALPDLIHAVTTCFKRDWNQIGTTGIRRFGDSPDAGYNLDHKVDTFLSKVEI
jgi:hypothetical protein